MALLVVTLTWGLIRVAPGNFYVTERQLPASVEKTIRAKYGLDEPWYTQYFRMMSNVVRGDFGNSLKYQGQSVNEIIWRHLPYSATIGILAYLLALLIGVSAGTYAALKQNSIFDFGPMSLAMLGLSIPNFVLAPVLVAIFAFGLYLLPPARWGGVSSLILPVITLGSIYAAYIARLTRAGMLEVLRSDFVRTARSKGLDDRTVLLRHAFRGGILPVISFTGPALAALLAGTVVVEKVFALPGLGDIFIKAVLNRDEPLILGIVAFLSILIMVFNLIVDITYGFLDPRIRYE
jgi:oligopeptide transport system permease protein